MPHHQPKKVYIMSTLANLAITIDPLAVEAARVAITAAVNGSESAYGRWVEAAKLVKAAWVTPGLVDKPLVTEWIISQLSETEQNILSAEVGTVDAKVRKAVQSKVSKYIDRMMERAYPPAVVVKPEPELTPEQADAKAAQVIATQAAIDKGAAVKAAADAEANKKIAAAEAKAAELKAKQAAAAAALDATQAEAAAIAQAEAEAKAVIAEEQAEAAEEAKAQAEEAKAAMLAAQADAKAKADAIQSAKCAEVILNEINVLLARVKGYADKVKGAEDLEAGLIGLRTDFKLDNDL
jgi:hypothetical protein